MNEIDNSISHGALATCVPKKNINSIFKDFTIAFSTKGQCSFYECIQWNNSTSKELTEAAHIRCLSSFVSEFSVKRTLPRTTSLAFGNERILPEGGRKLLDLAGKHQKSMEHGNRILVGILRLFQPFSVETHIKIDGFWNTHDWHEFILCCQLHQS